MGGFHGIPAASQLIGVWPTLIPRQWVEEQIAIELLETF